MESIDDLQRQVMKQVGGSAAYLGGSAAYLGGRGGKRNHKKKQKQGPIPVASEKMKKDLEKIEFFTKMQNEKLKGGGAFVLGGKKPAPKKAKQVTYKPQHAVLGGGNVDYLDQDVQEEKKNNSPSKQLHRDVADKAIDRVLDDLDPTQEVRGGNWWKDMKKGFSTSIKRFVSPVAEVLGIEALQDLSDIAEMVEPQYKSDVQKLTEQMKKWADKYHPEWKGDEREREIAKKVAKTMRARGIYIRDPDDKNPRKYSEYDYKGGAKPKKKPMKKPDRPLVSEKMKRRGALVKKIMKDKGLKLHEASSYIKKNNLPY